MLHHTLAFLSSAALVTASATAFEATGFHLLQPFQPAPGQTLVITTTSESLNGKITVTQGAATNKGTLNTKSHEILERTVSGSGKSAKLQYRTLESLRTVTSRLGETESTESTTGILVGIPVEGMRDQTQQWRLFPTRNSNDPKISIAVSELEAYENPRLFLTHPVRIGQSWPIDPGFVRHLIERDLGKSPIKATMTLKAIEAIDGEPTALLSFAIDSSGAKQDDDSQKQSAARVSLTGTLQVSLKTMLDKRTTMTGSLTSMTVAGGRSTTVSVPVNMTVTKSLR